MLNSNKILIGSRGSELALYQANFVKNIINITYPNYIVDLVIIKTLGDKTIDVSLSKLGEKGLFVKDIEEALIEKKIDIAVHSMKDMPVKLSRGLSVSAILKREDPRDVLVWNRSNCSSKFFRKNIKIATSSPRRAAQMLFYRPDLEIIPIRGNLKTRLNKLDFYNLDGIILAGAGLLRLGLKKYISYYLDLRSMVPAAGQGAICIQVRENDYFMKKMISKFDDFNTRCEILAERAFLSRLNGGCQIPIAVNAMVKSNRIVLSGLVANVNGSKLIKKSLIGSIDFPKKIGTKLAEKLIGLGAGKILLQ